MQIAHKSKYDALSGTTEVINLYCFIHALTLACTGVENILFDCDAPDGGYWEMFSRFRGSIYIHNVFLYIMFNKGT